MDNIAHLNRLSKINSSKSIRFLTPVAHPGSHCPMHSAISIAASIKGISSIVVGARECAYYSRGVPNVADFVNGFHWTYVMDSNEVVFGCRDGLIKAVRELDAAGAEAVALISTCVPEIIGEDIDGLIKEIQPEIKAKLLCVKVPQFNCNGSATGGLFFYESLISLMNETGSKPGVVNLLGYDPAAFRRACPPKLITLLRESGADVRFYYASEASVSDYARASEACLNLVFSIHNIGLAKRMEERFGIPYVVVHDLYGVKDWDAAIGVVEKILNISAAGRFAAERERALALEGEVSEKLGGRDFIMTFPYRDTLPLAAYLCDLGLKPLLIHADEYCPHNDVWARRILKSGSDPYVCHMVNEKADAEILNDLPFHICVGKFKYISGGRPCMQDMSDILLKYEYSRTEELLDMLIRCAGDSYGTL